MDKERPLLLKSRNNAPERVKSTVDDTLNVQEPRPLFHNLQMILGALIPIFSLIAVGYLFRRLRFPAEDFWPQMERLVYFALLPALLVAKLGTARVEAGRAVEVATAVAVTLVATSLLILLSRRLFPVDGRGFSSVYQGGIRFNTYLGLAVALAVYGENGTAMAAMIVAILIPLVNVGCVAVLSHYAGGRASPLAMLNGILRNPLIIACLVGIALNRSRIGLPWGTKGILEIAGGAALPLGLMTVGAGLRLRTAWGRGGVLAGTALIKLVVMPLIAWLAARGVGLAPLETRVLVLFSALPTATSAYILSRQMGGDYTLMATVLTVETAASAFTLPIVLLLLGA